MRNIIVIIIALIVLVVLGINLIIDNIHFDPNREFEETSRAFISLNLILAPSVIDSAIIPYGQWVPTSWPTFGFHRPMIFRLLQDSFIHSQDNELFFEGRVDSRFGRGRAVITPHAHNISAEELTIRQNFFSQTSIFQSESHFETVCGNGSYIVWIGFDSPMDKYSLLEHYYNFFSSEFSREHGILWLAIKTSDNPNDISLGFGGRENRQLNRLYEISGFQQNECFIRENEDRFIRTLTFLKEREVVTSFFIELDLWLHATTIDFAERLAFVEENGIKYLGFTIYVRGDSLRELGRHGARIVGIYPIWCYR